MTVRRTFLTAGVAVGLLALAAAFVLAQSDAHRLDRSVYGVTRDSDGDLAVVVSPCSRLGIGFVTVGIDTDSDQPEIVFSAEVTDPALAADEVVLSSPPSSYVVIGGAPDEASSAVVWNLRRADGGNLLPTPLEFVPSEITATEVLTGKREQVSQDDWSSC
jgi:hypothetical protein